MSPYMKFLPLKVSSSEEDVGNNYAEYNSSVLEYKDPDGTGVLLISD